MCFIRYASQIDRSWEYEAIGRPNSEPFGFRPTSSVCGENQCQVIGNEVFGFRVPRLSAIWIVDGMSSMSSAWDKAEGRFSFQ